MTINNKREIPVSVCRHRCVRDTGTCTYKALYTYIRLHGVDNAGLVRIVIVFLYGFSQSPLKNIVCLGGNK